MNIVTILIFVAVFIAASLVAPRLINWLRSVIPTASIQNNNMRRLAEASIYSVSYTALFTAAFALLGMGISVSTVAIWLVLFTAMEYFMPSRR